MTGAQTVRTNVLGGVYSTRDMKISVIRGLSYGRTGVGKTFFGGTFPRPLFLSAYTEGGSVTLRTKDGEAIDIYDSADMLNALQELHELANLGKLQWDSLIIDSITLYCEQYITELIKEAPGNRKMMRRVDWGQLDSHLRTITDVAHKLPMNIWWMALEDHEKDGDSGNVISAFPMLYGKRSAKILASMDIVLWHEYVKTGKNQPDVYRCHSKPYLYYDAKDRFSALPSPMVDPSFKKIATAIGLQP